MKVVEQKIKDLKPYKNNAKKHSKEQVEQIAESIKQFGFTQPVIVDKNNCVVAGHGRVLGAKKAGLKTVPTVALETLTDDEIKAYRLIDNKLNESEWDMGLLSKELDELSDVFDMSLFGFDDENDSDKIPGALRDEFIVPPFSVIDARNKAWQDRKRLWNKIIKSGLGRSDEIIGKGLKDLAKKSGSKTLTGTSVFDPCLTEVLVNWFCPAGGSVIDPFAGGSVRGMVTALTGRKYYGNDLSQAQIDENKKQYSELGVEKDLFNKPIFDPVWSVGDSKEIDKLIRVKNFDMLLTCPPYADLEVYSDDKRDISNMAYSDFLKVYKEIIAKTADKLKENAFACIVVGEVRDKNGIYRNFIGDTIDAAREAGLKYYNEIVFVTMVGTGAMRARRQFNASKKVCNTHQKALVFFKSKTDDAFEDMLFSFNKTKDVVPMKESVLVFLKGDYREAMFPVEGYNFDEF